MRLSGFIRLACYMCVGATGTAVQYTVLAVLIRTHALGAVAASCLGAIAGAIVNYFLNYRFTFRSIGSHSQTAPRFLAVAMAGIGLNGALMAALTHRLHVPWLPAQCITTTCVLVLTYTASSLWTFRARRT